MRICQPLPIVEIEVPHEGRRCRALLVGPHGFPNRSVFPFEIIGIFDPESPPPHSGPDGFRQNGTFLHFLHWVIAVDASNLPSTKAAARALGNGLLQVLDGRAKYTGDGEPDPRDILGAFEVVEGEIAKRSYRRTFTYALLTERGIFKLEPALCERVVERLATQVVIELRRGHA